MKKVLFIDRDGTIIHETADEQIDSFEKFTYLPGAIYYLRKIVEELDYEIVMVTNQDGLGTESFPEDTFWPVHNHLLKTLKGENITFADIYIDAHFPEDNAPTRKPGTGMLGKYMQGTYDLANSVVIGDRLSDVELAENLGSKSILICGPEGGQPTWRVKSWQEIYTILRFPDRTARVVRKTSETEIELAINLDGKGKAAIDTGIGFYDHMLELFAKHSGCDLSIKVKGDLHVDEHHTVEDTALCLGQAFKEAMGEKRGMERYGFYLPMDESRIKIALDFSGRNAFVWKAKFKREKVGKLATEMFPHIFKSFSDAAACNLHIIAKGKNEHHKIEGIFKGLAKAVKMAVRRDALSNAIPSTKGVL